MKGVHKETMACLFNIKVLNKRSVFITFDQSDYKAHGKDVNIKTLIGPR